MYEMLPMLVGPQSCDGLTDCFGIREQREREKAWNLEGYVWGGGRLLLQDPVSLAAWRWPGRERLQGRDQEALGMYGREAGRGGLYACEGRGQRIADAERPRGRSGGGVGAVPGGEASE